MPSRRTRGFPPGTVALATTVLLLSAPGPGRADLVLDQSLDPTGRITLNAAFGGPFQERAQTFTVGLAGQLAQVDVFVERFGTPLPGDTLILDIRATTPTGAPDPSIPGVNLATATVAASAVPGIPGGFTAFTLSNPIAVTPGEQLAIVLHSGSNTIFGWLGTTIPPDPYPGGAEYERVIGNHNWGQEVPEGDLGFRTFVDVAQPVPAPGALTLLVTGAGAMLAYRRRRPKAA
jgi:hypothetical protein